MRSTRGLNEYVHLPRMVIIVPDADLLRFFNHYTFGITEIAEHCINWLIVTMERGIEARKDALRRRRQGAVNPNEPKVIWIKMLNRVNGTSKMMKFRHKFNDALEQMLANRKCHYIMDVSEVLASPQNFTDRNLINARGKEVFWREVNKVIEDFDKQKISLRPVAKVFKKDKNTNNKDKFRMPPPPKKRKD